jgi:CHAD domain-containing protein
MATRTDGGLAAAEGVSLQSPRLRRALALTLPEEPRRLGADTPAIALVRCALARLVLELLHFEVLVRLRADVEDVHRARSTVRRLRAVLRGLRPFLDRVWADTLREELRWFAGELAAVRDIDVTLERLRSRADAIPANERPHLDVILSTLADARENARTRLLYTLESGHYASLSRTLEAAALTPKVAADEISTAKKLGKKSLRKTAKRVRKAVESASESCTANQLHHARIVVRNGRYVAEACQPVLGGPARRLAKRLARMQESLGAVSDATLIQNRLRTLVVHDGAGIVVGELLALQAVDGRRARRGWQRLRRKALQERWLYA